MEREKKMSGEEENERENILKKQRLCLDCDGNFEQYQERKPGLNAKDR